MSKLAGYRKADLLTLAHELGTEIESNDIVKVIIQKIESEDEYDEILALSQIKIISEDRERLAAEKKAEEKLQKEREYELAKARIEKGVDDVSIASSSGERPRGVQLKNIMQKFDPEKSDMALFLTLFQRQARKSQVPEDQLTTQLLSLLPVGVAEALLRESEENIDNFEFVREKLLARYKLSAENFRNKFMFHQKQNGTLWKDLHYELKNFLEGWLQGVRISDFEGLKNLMIADQLKRRAPQEMKEHFIDTWSTLSDPLTLVEKFDNYELVRKFKKKPWDSKNQESKKFEKFRTPEKGRNDKSTPETKPNWRERDQKDKSNIYEKRKTLKCFQCNSPFHMKYDCPELKSKSSVDRVANLDVEEELGPLFAPYLSKAVINEVEMTVLRDSGSSIDLISRNAIKTDQLNGDFLWIKQPLQNEFRCLPLANIQLEIENVGVVQTKAAVVDPEVRMQHYLLGNQTQELITKIKRNPQRVNAVVTRSKTKQAPISPPKTEFAQNSTGPEKKQVNKDTRGPSQTKSEVENKGEEGVSKKEGEIDEQDSSGEDISLPKLSLREREEQMRLVDVKREDFVIAQETDETLAEIRMKAKEKKSHFEYKEGLIFRVTADHHNSERVQLVVPLKFRERILILAHEGISSHLGCTKTKDKVLRYYFWPNVIKEIEEFVKCCDPCQRVGKSGGKKRHF